MGWTPRKIEELEHGKKKLEEQQRKAEKKNSWWKELKVWATVTMKEIPLATKDRTLNDDMVFQWCAKQIV